jgi:formate C-acetyltransferase
VIALAGRYADLAERLAASAAPERGRELREIAAVSRRVPEFPAETFHEALQSFWLVHYAFFSTGTALSCGRLDQFLHPALQRDLDSGALSLEQAQELIDCLWLRFNDRAQIDRDNFFKGDSQRDWAAGHRTRYAFATDAADAINHFGQNILLSGVRPDGSDGTNELTYLCLNALEKLAYTSPVVTMRLHGGSPEELTTRTAEVLKTGGGMPYINNDDAIVQAYVGLGVPPEDAANYANSNCWETMIEGRSDQELIRGMNFLLCLELALNRGRSAVHGEMGPDTGDPSGFRTFDQVMDAWKTQLDHQLQLGIDHIGNGVKNGTLEHSNHGRYNYNPLLSALTLDCLANEKDVIRGGARYTIWHVMGEAVANAIDAMAAIKKLVFEERALDMGELLDALAADWDGHENLRRRIVARAPGFANDDDYADDIGREMMEHFVGRTAFHARRHPEVIFPPAVGTFSWYAMIGREVGATPDGRRHGEPVAANFSPAPGSDLNGPTAAINSYLKMPVGALAAGAPMDLRFSASGLAGEAGTHRLAGVARTFVEMGGNMLTITVTDVEELKRAMEEPEKYRHLRVRMGGWSAYFVMLSREQQLLHISRVEHGVA